MNLQVTASGARKILIIAVLGLISALLLIFFSPRSQQDRNLSAADRQATLLLPIVHADARFRDIQINQFTANGGSLQVLGSVDNPAALSALKAIVIASKPPVKTRFTVFVLPAGPAIDELIPPQ